MKKILYTLVTILFIAFSVNAQSRVQGYDALGLAMYCNEYLKAPKLPAVSTLLNTFGNPLPCLQKRINQGGLKVIQIDLIDATCWRNRVCPAGVPKPTDFKVIKKRAQSVSKFLEKNAQTQPELEWWLSPALEHDVKDKATVQKMMKAAQDGCPKCKIINSPYSGARLDPLELHGTSVRSFAVSGDGKSIFDGDCLKNDNNDFYHPHSGKDQTYAWWNELNLRCTGEEKFTSPKKRTEKPTQDQFKQAYLTMTTPEPPKPNPPAICKSVRDIMQGKEITKPRAESYCNGQKQDPRGNKPLLIIRHKGTKRGQRINVYNPSGRRVAAFCYYDIYKDLPQTYRWYMGDCSGHTPTALYEALGGEWGFVDLGKGQCLRFNSIRRQGTYR